MAIDSLEDHPAMRQAQEVLAQPVPLDLRNFAREVSQGVNSYLKELPWYSRWVAALEKWLDPPLTSLPRLAVGGAFAAFMAWLALSQPRWLLPVCWAIGLFICVWPTLARRCRPQWPVRWTDRRSKLFRMVPMLAVLLSGISCFTLVQNVVYPLQAPYDPYRQLALLGVHTIAALMVVLMLRIVGPIWDALEGICLGSRWRLALFQGVHVAWLMAAWLSLDSGHYYSPFQTPEPFLPGGPSTQYWDLPSSTWTLLVLIVALVAVLRLSRAKFAPPPTYRLTGATARSLAIGLVCLAFSVPVVAAIWDPMLSTRMENPALYTQMKVEVDALDEELHKLPASSNGYLLVKDFGKNEKLFDSYQDPKRKVLTPREVRNWLAALPVVRRALEQPRFEPLEEKKGGGAWSTLEALQWGLSGLVAHHLKQGEFESALDCVILELKLSKAVSTGQYFHLAGRLTSTALEDARSWLADTHPTAAQRRRLLEQLQASRPTLAEYNLRVKRSLCRSMKWLDSLDNYPYNPYSPQELFWRRYAHSFTTQFFNRATADLDGRMPRAAEMTVPQDWVDAACRRRQLSLYGLTYDFRSNLQGFERLVSDLR